MSFSLDAILQAADDHNASDVFLMEGEIPRMKIDERLLVFGENPIDQLQMVGLWQACGADPLVEMDRDSGLVSNNNTRYRVNMHKAMGRLGVVMRRIRTDLPVLANLGLPDWLLTKWAAHSRGLILVTGPTGMGKSTTMAGLLQWMNETCARHIVTIEDPVEFIYPNQQCIFTQREVGRDTPSFARGIRSAMRQAPDVIMVGEIRDTETAQATLQASETGHLVLASIHSDNAVDAMDRVGHLFPPEQSGLDLLSQQLIGVVCQKLVPSASHGLLLLVEHLENAGAVKTWLARQEMEHIRNYMQRGDDPASITFLKSIVAAYGAGYITEQEAIVASGNEMEFKRAARGIS